MMLPPIHNAAHTGVYVVETFMSVFIKVAISFKKGVQIPRIFLRGHVFEPRDAELASFMEIEPLRLLYYNIREC
jgi:hypothetical protein